MDLQEKKYNFALSSLHSFLQNSSFDKVVIGLSGGIDSAFTATLAADAVGPANVFTFMLPSCYTHSSSVKDAQLVASNLGIKHDSIAINKIVESFSCALNKLFINTKTCTTEENIQARTRAVILMAVANKFNRILLATGNRSEIMTGYCTLYGDTCGGYAPISCFFKTEVYELAKWRNSNIPATSLNKKHNPIPTNVIKKDPSAELKPNQKDSDFLPRYEVLDKVLQLILDNKCSLDSVIQSGFSPEVVKKVHNLVKNSAHKRTQLPHGPCLFKP